MDALLSEVEHSSTPATKRALGSHFDASDACRSSDNVESNRPDVSPVRSPATGHTMPGSNAPFRAYAPPSPPAGGDPMYSYHQLAAHTASAECFQPAHHVLYGGGAHVLQPGAPLGFTYPPPMAPSSMSTACATSPVRVMSVMTNPMTPVPPKLTMSTPVQTELSGAPDFQSTELVRFVAGPKTPYERSVDFLEKVPWGSLGAVACVGLSVFGGLTSLMPLVRRLPLRPPIGHSPAHPPSTCPSY